MQDGRQEMCIRDRNSSFISTLVRPNILRAKKPGLTALSDEEVIYKDEHSKLYYLRYFIEGEDKYIIVATTRPETILGDTALMKTLDKLLV